MISLPVTGGQSRAGKQGGNRSAKQQDFHAFPS